MRPQTMMAVGVVAVVAAAGLVSKPSTGPGSGPGGARDASAAATPSPAPAPQPPMGVGERLITEFLALPPGGSLSPDSLRPGLTVLIATVPDPVESGLDWAFDAVTAALRSALESCGFVLDRQRLPWYDRAGRIGGVSAESPAWMEQPGALLWRRTEPGTKELVLVYLVGESPTSGVARQAFLAALTERDALASSKLVKPPTEPSVIRVIGPTFSGSSRSIRVVLDAYRLSRAEPLPAVLILTGGATNYSNAEELTGRKPTPDDCRLIGDPPDSGISFCSTVHPDPDLRQALTVVAKALYPGQRETKIVNFYEATTSYGQQFRPDTSEQSAGEQSAATKDARRGGARRQSQPWPTLTEVSFPFPMSISVLRTAGKAPSSPPTQAVPAPWAARATRTQLSLTELHPSVDLPLPASSLAPAYLEVVLNSMVHAARSERPQLAGILATDVRDKIFLASVLQGEMPDLQLYTFESNLLFLWPEFADPLRGMLVLTSYPLNPDAQRWTAPTGTGGALHFLMEGAEGVFNATRLHLGQAPLLEYRTPFPGPEGIGMLEWPPVWVTAVGRDGLVPLRLLQTGDPAAKGYVARVPAHSASTRMQGQLGAGSVVLLLALGVVALVVAFTSLRDAALNPDASGPRWSLGAMFGTGIAEDPLERLETPEIEGAEPSRRDVLLLVREELCSAAVLVALACIVLPIPLLCLGVLVPGVGMPLPWQHPTWPFISYWSALALATVMILIALVAALAAAVRAAVIVVGNLATFRGALGETRDPERRHEGVRWVVEGVATIAAAVLALCFFLSFAELAVAVRRLASAPDGALQLFLQRLFALDSGVSPLPPLMLIGFVVLATYTWGLWHGRSLRSVVAFEICTSESKEPGIRALFRQIARLRDRLHFLAPDWGTAAILAGVLVAADLWWARFGPSLEAVAFAAVMQERPFDKLLRLGVLFGVGAIAWLGYRFVSAWSAFRGTLSALAGRPIAGSFRPIAVGLRRRLFRWAIRQRPDVTEPDPLSAQALTLLRSNLRATDTGAKSQTARLLRESALDEEVVLSQQAPVASMQVRLAHVLGGVLEVLAAAGSFRRREDGAPPSDSVKDAKPRPRTGAEAFFAAQFAAFCQKVSLQLWLSAAAAFAVWIAMSLLVSSYPHVAPSSVQTALAIELGALIVVFFFVTFQMSRDPILSALNGSTKNRFTLDPDTTLRLIMFVVTPFLALLGSETSAIRRLLGSSLSSLLKLLAQGAPPT